MSEPMTRGERIGVGIAFLVVFGLFGLEIAINYEAAKLGALAFALSWAPLLAVHESGHAVVARLLGLRVDAVVIGFGKTMWQGEIRGTQVEVRVFPIEGFTLTRGGSGVRSALVYFAGPGAELLVAALILLVVGPSTLFAESESIPVIACQGVCIAAVFSAAVNLWPTEVRKDDHPDARRIANDGLGIWRSLKGR